MKNLHYFIFLLSLTFFGLPSCTKVEEPIWGIDDTNGVSKSSEEEEQQQYDCAPSLSELKGKRIKIQNAEFYYNNGWDVYIMLTAYHLGQIETASIMKYDDFFFTPYNYKYTDDKCNYGYVYYEKIDSNNATLTFNNLQYGIAKIGGGNDPNYGAIHMSGEALLFFTDKNKGTISYRKNSVRCQVDESISILKDLMGYGSHMFGFLYNASTFTIE